jgi:hypothetical protein
MKPNSDRGHERSQSMFCDSGCWKFSSCGFDYLK